MGSTMPRPALRMGGLIAHEGGDLAHDLAEFLDTGVLVAKHGQLVVDEGVVEYMKLCHDLLSSVYSVWENNCYCVHRYKLLNSDEIIGLVG